MSLQSQTPKAVSVGASAAHTTIPCLVSKLRATTRDFDRVERALLGRESRLIAAIQEKDKEIASLKVKDSIHSLDKLNLESQLREFRNGRAKVLAEVKKEDDVGSDSSVAGKCMHCSEMKNNLEKENGVSESLRDRNTQLEFEKSKLLEEKKKWDGQRGVVEDLMKRNIELEAEKCGLLEAKKKLNAAKSGTDGLRKEESPGAEAPVENRKRKFIELSEERETAENDNLISLDDNGGADGGGGDVEGDGSNSEENKTVQIDGVGVTISSGLAKGPTRRGNISRSPQIGRRAPDTQPEENAEACRLGCVRGESSPLEAEASSAEAEASPSSSRHPARSSETEFQRSTAAESESIQEDLHLAPLHHHPRILPVAMKKGGQEDPSPGPRDQRRKRRRSQEQRILELMMKMVAQFAFQNFLGMSRVDR